MKKVLVIENWEKFKDFLREEWNSETIKSVLLDHELKDVVEFEADIDELTEKVPTPIIHVPDNDMNIGVCDEVRVFVVKKPEEET